MRRVIDKGSGKFLRRFGVGLTDNKDDAATFSDDQIAALQALYDGFWPEDYGDVKSELKGLVPPGPNDDRTVWVRHHGCWFPADKQALYLGATKDRSHIKEALTQ